MPELRKDYILNRWVVIATERSKRPNEFKQKIVREKTKNCFFCVGNEHLTPPEIGRIEEQGKWKIRWFDNLYAAVELKGNPIIRTDNAFYTFSDGYGKHEIIVETPDHKKQLWDLPEEHLKQVLETYAHRIRELSKLENIKYVSVFKNHGKEAGTSLVHSHSQVIAVNFIPKLIKEEIEATKKFDSCPYCKIIDIEKGSFRRCFENECFVAFTPYASRFHFETWIFPKQHLKSLNDFDESKLLYLAGILKKVLLKLKEINASYNMFLHYAPDGEDLHFHIEIAPRLAVFAGFEYSTDAAINSLSPEEAAKFYRGEG